MADIPIILPKTGAQPRSPADLRNELVTRVAAENPGYTANLPGALIEDIASTDVGALALCDAFYVDMINSLTPFGANEMLLNQLGQIYGVTHGLLSNTSVFVTFNGPSGFVIAKGFVVSDGTHQYVIQDGGVIPLDGISPSFFALATVGGTWTVPADTVNQIVTSVPSTVLLTVNNPVAGISGNIQESEESYRARVLRAGRAAATGMASLLKTALGGVPGVQPRLVSVVQSQLASALLTGGGWEIIVGGGDPYQVAYAIYSSIFDISLLVGSTILITNVTKANPGVVTTQHNHNKATGNTIFIGNIGGMIELNGGSFIITVIDEKTFSIGVDTTSFTTYTSGGIVEPNDINQTVSLLDYPDVYEVIYVIPPQQVVGVTLLWNTDSPNFVSGAAVNALGVPAIVAYINAVPVSAPINIFDLERAFQDAVATVLPSEFLSRMIWTISINGVATSPNTGTQLVYGDPESYFQTEATSVTVNQG